MFTRQESADMKIQLTDLPDDMQVLLADLSVEELSEFAIVQIEMARFPVVPISDGFLDCRGEAHVEAMRGCALPPVIVSGSNWLDGRHRVEAMRRDGIKTVSAIDIPMQRSGNDTIGKLYTL